MVLLSSQTIRNYNFISKFIFQHGVRWMANIKWRKKLMLPCIKRIAAWRPLAKEVDFAPCHTCSSTLCWLSENFCNPYQLSKLYTKLQNFFDYYMFDVFEEVANKTIEHQRLTEGKNNSSIWQFKQVDSRKSLHEILKSTGVRGWSQSQFLCTNLIFQDIFL